MAALHGQLVGGKLPLHRFRNGSRWILGEPRKAREKRCGLAFFQVMSSLPFWMHKWQCWNIGARQLGLLPWCWRSSPRINSLFWIAPWAIFLGTKFVGWASRCIKSPFLWMILEFQLLSISIVNLSCLYYIRYLL